MTFNVIPHQFVFFSSFYIDIQLSLPYLTLPYLILPYLIVSYRILCYLILSYLILSYLILSYLTLPYLTLFSNTSHTGKRLAIISNQNGISSKNTTTGEVQRKVDAIIAELGIPIDFICAIDDDIFKKPRTGINLHKCFIFPFVSIRHLL